jgi:hypothetical protein
VASRDGEVVQARGEVGQESVRPAPGQLSNDVHGLGARFQRLLQQRPTGAPVTTVDRYFRSWAEYVRSFGTDPNGDQLSEFLTQRGFTGRGGGGPSARRRCAGTCRNSASTPPGSTSSKSRGRHRQPTNSPWCSPNAATSAPRTAWPSSSCSWTTSHAAAKRWPGDWADSST